MKGLLHQCFKGIDGRTIIEAISADALSSCYIPEPDTID